MIDQWYSVRYSSSRSINDQNHNGIYFFERFKKGKVIFLCTLFELGF
jgi:hypothetical protein